LVEQIKIEENISKFHRKGNALNKETYIETTWQKVSVGIEQLQLTLFISGVTLQGG